MEKRLTGFLLGLTAMSALSAVNINNTYAAQVLAPNQMKAQLTSQDIKEATPRKEKAKGTDDIGEVITNPDATKKNSAISAFSAYPNVNSYILNKNFQHPEITKELHTFEMFPYKTDDGKPSGVVVHYTANPNDFSARNGANYEINGGWESAFVHTFIDADMILNIHDTDYGAWGAGPVANKYFTQFEMVTARNFNDFAKTTSYSAWYTAFLLQQYGLTPSLAHDDGVGTIWTHHDVTNFLGGTDHVDPDDYFAQYGYDINQFYSLVQHYYQQMTEKVVNRQYIDKTGSVVGNKAEYWLTDNGLKPANQTTDNLVNKAVKVTQLITMTSGKQYYLATVNGNQVAWIPVDSFKVSEMVTNRQYVDKTGTITGGQPEYWLTDSGIKSANQTTGNLAGKTVKVTQLITTTAGKQYYLATVNGKQIAWVPMSAFKQGETVVSRQYVNKTGMVVNNQPEYWLTDSGIKSANQTTSNLTNKSVKVTQLITTTSGKQYYLATVNGKQIAWIPATAFNQGETVVNRQYINKLGTVISGQPEYWLTDGGIKSANQTTSNLASKSVKVTQLITTTTGKQYYLATVKGKQVAWIPVAAFKQGETVVNRQYVNKLGRAIAGQPEYWLTDDGIKSANQTTSNLANKSVKVTQLITTTTGKQYYLATVNGKQVAWILVTAFK
ncbi:GW dipeptide domain-containing protein [Latilactobacillus sakei]|uniref:GW dipeptide domain-containing protein n=2 Tax=Latilactobacillus sakei TaxID=1599 RepID=UPI00046B0506|nr:GW dipeptide domain-containing protein [Latilactobacillus sakei]AST84130.1 hypothetical protein LBS_06095 [Latilactobacillus sakei]AYG15467.1 hypothetical protein CFK78_00060 [Latilactobacillus sakei]AYG25979.1 hypothetical protein CFM83_07655 [Latilactobacillus sakei]AYG29640.1 hypothetical protein CFK76_00955 [Latilactobacillus sakei]AYG32897.1 hypothetical protein CFN54_08350 [Latilactobacillus sakei]